jgi:thioredoxin-disulfide reductase
MYDLIIVGGGPAGITAGIYALRKKIKTLIVAKDFIGQAGLAGVVENWPGEKEILGIELMMKLKDHLSIYNPEIKEEEVISIQKKDGSFVVETKEEKYFSKTVLLTTGRKARKLNVLGEKEFLGKGVAYCTTCDAPLFQDKKVVVVGGGNAGFEGAIELIKYTKDVSIFEFSSKIIADEALQEKAKNVGVKVFTNYKVEEVIGSNFLEKIKYTDLISGEIKEVEAKGLFVQIGSTAITDFAKDLIEIDKLGDIVINPNTYETKTEGLFAAGDVTNVKHKQIVIATGEGAKASLSINDFLKQI